MLLADVKHEPPQLEFDIGFSLPAIRPAVSFKAPLPNFGRKRDAFSLPFKTWRIWQLARGDAKRGLPDYSSAELSSAEVNILRERQLKMELLDRGVRAFVVESSRLIDELTPVRFTAEDRIRSVKNSVFSWLEMYQEYLVHAYDEITRTRKEVKQSEAKLELFRADHKLSNIRPRSRAPLGDRVGYLALAALVEALLSMVLFAEVSEYGYLGAAAIAIAISICNILLGLSAGFAATYSFRVNRQFVPKVLAVVFVMLDIALVVWINLFVSHFRERTTLSWDNVFPETALSAVLLGIAFVVWGFALFKGWQDFSPDHDGHIDLWEEDNRAHTQATEARVWCIHLVNAMRSIALARMDQARRRLTEYETGHAVRLDRIKDLHRNVLALRDHLPSVRRNVSSPSELLLKKYRETNYACRKKRAEKGLQLRYAVAENLEEGINLQTLTDGAQKSEELIDENIRQLRQFRVKFETEVADSLNAKLKCIQEQAAGRLAGDRGES